MLGKSEVDHLDVALLVQEKVLGLEVPADDDNNDDEDGDDDDDGNIFGDKPFLHRTLTKGWAT